MNEDEKAEMLADITMLIGSKLSRVIDEVHSYFKTYPELQDVLSLVIDVSLCDTNLIQVVAGHQSRISSRLKNIQEKIR